MQAIGPHYLLLTDTVGQSGHIRQWRFVLEPTGDGNGERIVAADVEHDADLTRLELLAVVRGLEALDGPSRVTLLAANRFVRRGIRHDLCQWREHNWRWERFGKLVPIRDLDLWQRVDRALGIHQVECLAWHAGESEMQTGRFSAPSIGEHFAAINSHCEPTVVKVRRHGHSSGRGLAQWGHEMLNQLAGWGQPALSQSA